MAPDRQGQAGRGMASNRRRPLLRASDRPLKRSCLRVACTNIYGELGSKEHAISHKVVVRHAITDPLLRIPLNRDTE